MHRKIFCCEIKANKQLKYESERKREKKCENYCSMRNATFQKALKTYKII